MPILKCCTCGGAATRECDYCHQPMCTGEACCKLIEGLDAGIACTTCFAVLMTLEPKGPAGRRIRVVFVPGKEMPS